MFFLEEDIVRISIVVPVYNVEKYLNECVKSIIDQSFADFELILVDDGSSDRCPQICDDWATKDDRVRVIHKPNGGSADARNYGIKAQPKMKDEVDKKVILYIHLLILILLLKIMF